MVGYADDEGKVLDVGFRRTVGLSKPPRWKWEKASWWTAWNNLLTSNFRNSIVSTANRFWKYWTSQSNLFCLPSLLLMTLLVPLLVVSAFLSSSLSSLFPLFSYVCCFPYFHFFNILLIIIIYALAHQLFVNLS